MKKLFFIILFLKVSIQCNSQNLSKDYVYNIKKAYSLFKSKNYTDAAVQYTVAFVSFNNQGQIIDRYYAASCWALINNSDSAFYQLNRIVFKGKFVFYDQLKNDSNFKILNSDKRWAVLLEGVKKNIYEINDKLRAELPIDQE